MKMKIKLKLYVFMYKFLILMAIIILSFIASLIAASWLTERTELVLSICTNRTLWWETEQYNRHICQSSGAVLSERLNFLVEICKVLKEHNLIYFICGGTLWAAIREYGLLPYDINVDICTLDATLSQVRNALQLLPDVTSFEQHFGSFKLRRGLADAEITLYFTTNMPSPLSDENMVQHYGYDHWLLPRFCNVEKFPERLLSPLPLPTADISGYKFPVPRENFEIMRYLYPHSWERVEKPPGCH